MPKERAIKNHPAERNLLLSRILVAVVVMFIMSSALLARIGWLQITRHDYYQTQARDNRMRVQVTQPVRGLIYDRNGHILAQNLPAYRLVVTPEQVEDMATALDQVARFIDISNSDRRRFEQRLQASPSFRPIPLRLDLSQIEVARFEVNRYRFPGMEIQAGLARHYPLGPVTAHLLGHVGGITARDLFLVERERYRGASHIGKAGIELQYESLLRGALGSRITETSAVGRTIRELEYHAPESGKNLYLTLDSELQRLAYEALEGYSGSVVALDPQSGAVLAMVSRPSYDPNRLIGGISKRDYQALLSAPHNPLFRRATQGRYPPGSVVKPIMAIAALESNVVDPQKKVWCPGYVTLEGSSHQYRDWLRSGHGWLDMRQAIYRSSDVYFYKQAMKMGIDTMHKYGDLFGLGRKTGIDLPNEHSGLMPSRKWKRAARGQPWFPGESLITVIGQGAVTSTPLQLAHMTALIANRGKGYKPHLLQAVQDADSGRIQPYPPEALPELEIDDSVWDVVIDGMRSVVNAPRGTAHYYIGQNLDYSLAGKSGTSQVAALKQNVIAPNIEDMAYNLRPHALFIAFAPIEDPQIAVAVVVEHGGGGSSVAGPIARQVIDSYLFNKLPVLQARAGDTP